MKITGTIIPKYVDNVRPDGAPVEFQVDLDAEVVPLSEDVDEWVEGVVNDVLMTITTGFGSLRGIGLLRPKLKMVMRQALLALPEEERREGDGL